MAAAACQSYAAGMCGTRLCGSESLKAQPMPWCLMQVLPSPISSTDAGMLNDLLSDAGACSTTSRSDSAPQMLLC